jgi:hypothetical protein
MHDAVAVRVAEITENPPPWGAVQDRVQEDGFLRTANRAVAGLRSSENHGRDRRVVRVVVAIAATAYTLTRSTKIVGARLCR